jgi:hypothetical protein
MGDEGQALGRKFATELNQNLSAKAASAVSASRGAATLRS